MASGANPTQHQRKSIRLEGYDYSKSGAYFVALCTQNRALLFEPEPVGTMIQCWWDKLPGKFLGIQTDAFVITPNHVHGIIITVGADPRVGPGQSRGIAPALGRIVQWFKTMTTNEYIHSVKEGVWTPFPGKLWQRNYYEHIVRNQREMDAIRQYIINNPLNWLLDRDNPNNRANRSTHNETDGFLEGAAGE